jgi:HTH-type transcriptional regulator/antitoxin HipB
VKENYPISTPIELRAILRSLRQSRGLNQEDAARLLGVTQGRLARIEAAPERTSFEQISRLVTALGGRLEVSVATVVTAKKPDARGGQKTPSRW